LIVFELESAVLREQALGLTWGSHEEERQTLQVVRQVEESADVTSITFGAADGRALEPFGAGQYLPIAISPAGQSTAVERTYSLFDRTDDEQYRISVKREPNGVASNYIHNELQVGDVVDASRPTGDLLLSDTSKPKVLISAGVGQHAPLGGTSFE
jgi:uncharacterized protein